MWRRILFLAVLLSLGGICARAQEGGDKVHFGENIVVRQGETANNVVCFFCAVSVQGHANGNVVVFFADAAISGQVEQNAVIFFGNLHLFSHGSVGQNAVIFAGRLHSTSDSTVGQNRVVFPPVVFLIPLLILCGLFAAFVYMIRAILQRRQRRYAARPS